MKPSRKASCPRPAEEGYVLAAVIIMLAVMMILLAAAVPKVREDIRRDQEVETMHRGQQYIRAVQLYYRKFHQFPPNVDALEDTNMMRFLRKRYDDPLTGKYDWKPVLYGANKAPLTMGYFGVPLTMGAAVLTGSSATGGNQIVGASPIGSGSGFTSAFGPDAGSGISSTGSGSQSTSPSPGPILGGSGIQGFSPAPVKASILVYKTKDHYNEWEFVYDPTADRVTRGMPFQPPPGPPPVNSGAPGLNGPAPAPPPPPPPAAPQQ
jgi:type II secretory pathway pseudopilin PulG